MTLGLGELHKLSHGEQGLAQQNGDVEHGEVASLLAAVPASPTASNTRQPAAAAQRETSSSLVFGLLLYAACTICSSGMSILAKLANAKGIPVMQIVLVRSAMVSHCAGCFLVWCRMTGSPACNERAERSLPWALHETQQVRQKT